MNAETIFGMLLAAFALGVAAYVVLARDLFGVIVGFVAYGLLLSLAWMVLSAPDVAMTEAALGSGVMGALLFGACAKLRGAEAGPAVGGMGKAAAAVMCAALTAALTAVVMTLPEPAPTLAPEAREALAPTGLGNAVTAVLMVYRALDTMLEKVVLLIAVVAVWSLAPARAWAGRPVYELAKEKNGPLVFLARALIPAGLVAGVYLFWVGADDPGSAFAGGAILAAMALLASLAGMRVFPAVRDFRLRALLVIGVAVFLGIGLAGLVAGSGFLTYPEGFAKPVIVLVEVAMTLSIGTTLALLVAGPPAKISVS